MKYDKRCATCLVLHVLVVIWLRLVIGSWCLHVLMKYPKHYAVMLCVARSGSLAIELVIHSWGRDF